MQMIYKTLPEEVFFDNLEQSKSFLNFYYEKDFIFLDMGLGMI